MHNKYQAGTEPKSHIANFADLVNDPVMGLDKFIRFHNLWVAKPMLLIIWYKDLRANTEQEIMRLLKFIDGPLDRAALKKAVQFSSFDNMKSLELNDNAPRYKSSGFKIFSTGDRQNPNAYHLRQGLVGGYADHLTAEQSALFVDRIRRQLSPVYGYSGILADGTQAT